ncbi:MAG TPA: phosphatidylserine decarboxylase [Terriglobia bacterium]|nr:phosphatidylserine decarboxylase [Terriglobia bacterium]
MPLLVISGLLLAFRLYWAGGLFFAVAVFVLSFFRDPERRIPAEPRAIVSPADGRVVQIVGEQIDGCEMQRMSIFMAPWNVHVNRAPASGILRKVSYHPGTFHIASRPGASVENEQNVFTIESEEGSIHVRQIAGALARRIVFWKRPGDWIKRGERVGLIKFGSRVDVIVRAGTEWRVKVGDHVRAGSTIIGISKPEEG